MIKPVLVAVCAMLAGAALGTFATIYHRLNFPFGVAATLTLSMMSLVEVRKFVATYSTHRWFGAGLVTSVVWHASGDGVTSSLIILDLPGLIFISGMVAILVLSLGWPDFRGHKATGT